MRLAHHRTWLQYFSYIFLKEVVFWQLLTRNSRFADASDGHTTSHSRPYSSNNSELQLRTKLDKWYINSGHKRQSYEYKDVSSQLSQVCLYVHWEGGPLSWDSQILSYFATNWKEQKRTEYKAQSFSGKEHTKWNNISNRYFTIFLKILHNISKNIAKIYCRDISTICNMWARPQYFDTKATVTIPIIRHQTPIFLILNFNFPHKSHVEKQNMI